MANPKKKQFGDARAAYGSEQEGQPFGQYDDEVLAALDAGQVQAETLPIMNIWADKTQPRNIIPREVHSGWTGNPAAMPDILGAWIEAIYDTGADLPIEEILLGKGGGSDKTNSLPLSTDPIVAKFMPVLSLASQIRDIGLQQRIGVIALGKNDYRIIYGERRWTAFHLLKMFLGDSYSSIPAKVAKVTEWELAKIQAAENFHQNPLNAIGKARQLAKLLILARKDQQDPPYDSWDALVVEGGCNRPYFAQVADGNIHRIPKGMGEEFERTLNISVEQMRQYRGLLRLTGDFDIDNTLWDMGHDRDWSERFMRDIASLDLKIIRQIFAEAKDPEEMLREAVSANNADKKSQNTVTVVTVSDNATLEEAAPKSPFGSAIGVATGMGSASKLSFKFGDEVITPDGAGHIIQTTGNTHLVKLDSGPSQRYGDGQLQPAAQGDSWFDKYVQTIAGKVAHVLVDFGEDCEIEYADGGRSKIDKEYLSFVDKSEWDAEVQRHREQQPPVNLMNFVGKVVHTFQGVGKVNRNHDANYVEVQFPDGDTLNIAKKDLSITDSRHWDEAVAALKSGEAAGNSGLNELSLKDVSSSITNKIRQLNPKAFDGIPFDAGWVVLHRQIMKKYGLNHHIVLAFKANEGYIAIDHDANKLIHAMRTVKHPFIEGQMGEVRYCYVDWKGIMNVLDNTGAHYITYRPPAAVEHLFNQAIETVLRGSDNVNSLPPANPPSNPAPGANDNKPREWVGKPAMVKENGYKYPVFVQEFVGAGMLRVATNSGKQLEVHFSQLEAVETGETRLSDFMNGDDPDHDHSDLINKRVRLQNGEIGTITAVDDKRISLKFTEFVTGSALIEHIVEVLDDDAAEETKAITDVDTQALLRHIGHLTGRENTVLKLINLTRQNAIDAYKAQQLVPDLQLIRDSIKSGFAELISEVENILETIVTEAEELAD